MDVDVASVARLIAADIRDSVPSGWLNSERRGYGHMGATLTDTILQSGLRYETVVKPRVNAVLQRFPEAVRTTGFQTVLESVGPKAVLQWSHDEKPRRLLELVSLLAGEDVQTESDLRTWMRCPENRGSLAQIRGIGPKTIDYLAILAGGDTIAIDRHILQYVEGMSASTLSYEEARGILLEAAVLIGCPASVFDMALWEMLSKRRH